MPQRIKILLHEEVPPSIVRIVREEFEALTTVEQVLFTHHCELLEGRMAAFVPATGSVVIDLDACIKDLRWMEKGATFIANAWFNLLYCIYHESCHAQQVEEGLDLKLSNDLLEVHADENALEDMMEWAMQHDMPTLKEMGYVGEKVKEALDRLQNKRPELVELELNACGKGVAIARVAATRCAIAYATEESIASLETAIDDGRVDGIIIDNTRYLQAQDFINIDGERGKH